MEDGNILYSGILVSYELGTDGGLRTTYLRSAQRKQLNSTSDADATATEYYPVAGDLLTLPYAQLLNLNVSYFISEKDAQAEGDDQTAALVSSNTEVSASDSEGSKEETNQ